MSTIRDQVTELLASKRQWSNGETVQLCEGRGCRVTVSEGSPNMGGFLFLEIRNGSPGAKPVKRICGYLKRNHEHGGFAWVESLKDSEYSAWVTEAKAKVYPRGAGNGQP